MDAGGARLILPGFIQQLQEMIRGLSQADGVELLRRAFIDANKSHVFCYRLSDEVESRCIMYANPHGLTDRSTGTSVMTMKITAKLFRLIWVELDGQNQQLYQEVKKECFREIVGQSMEKLLDVALSLSDAGWSADPPLAILDALVDVLYNIKDLPFSRTELIPNELHCVVAHIFYKMVVDLRGIIGATTDDMHSSRESTIHTSTVLLVRFLEFFYRNGEMMQSVLGTGYCTIELTMINIWVSKLLRDSEIMFPAKTFHIKGQRHIFVLNNIFYVYQMKCRPGGFLSDMELESLWSLIHQYMKCYLDEYWVPFVTYLDGVSLKTPCRSSMDKFIKGFFSIRDSHMTWKVRTELKQILREEIVELIVPKYEIFLRILQEENPDLRWPCWSKGTWRAKSEKPVYYTAGWLEQVIRGLFER
ncbi:hypothetical protein ACQ4PT_069267 [Festuca glaucescens]